MCLFKLFFTKILVSTNEDTAVASAGSRSTPAFNDRPLLRLLNTYPTPTVSFEHTIEPVSILHSLPRKKRTPCFPRRCLSSSLSLSPFPSHSACNHRVYGYHTGANNRNPVGLPFAKAFLFHETNRPQGHTLAMASGPYTTRQRGRPTRNNPLSSSRFPLSGSGPSTHQPFQFRVLEARLQNLLGIPGACH